MRAIGTLTSSASLLAQLLIGIDQYLAVLNPLHYHRRINESRCNLMCLTAWIISITLAILNYVDFANPEDLVFDTNQSIIKDLFKTCSHGQPRSLYQFIILLVTTSVSFVLPLLILIIIYCRVFYAARSNSIRTRRNSSCSMTYEGVANPNNIHYGGGNYLGVSNNNLSRSPSVKSNGSNLMNLTSNLRASMRSKISHASHLLLYGEESRAAKVTIFVLLAIAFCWIPYHGMALYNLFSTFFEEKIFQMPNWINILALICGLSNTVLSPILYAYRSKRVQKDVRKVLGLSIRPKAANLYRNPNAAKVRRLKSFSCPQLLVSSVNDNNETTNNSTSKSFITQFSLRNPGPESSVPEFRISNVSAEEAQPLKSHQHIGSLSVLPMTKTFPCNNVGGHSDVEL